MSLEATMILIDNSDWSRNGDFPPNRWEAQIEAIQLIQNSKLNAHAESCVGIMTMGSNQVDVLATPTNDEAKIMASLYGVQIGGKIQFSNALKIAQLVLKHRLNLQQKQRIVAFVASPIEEETEKELTNLAKKFKKNNIAVDIINLGQIDGNHIQKLQKFVENVNKEDNSHFININPGINLLQDSLIGTPILGSIQQGGQEGGAFNELGIDPNADPELAQALRISLEEEKERVRQQELKKQNEQQQPAQQQNQMIPEQSTVANNNANQQISSQQQQPNNAQQQNVQTVGQQPPQQQQQQQQQQQPQKQQQQVASNMEEELDEEELLERAKFLSLGEGPQLEQVQDLMKEKQKEQSQKLFQDADFVNELMSMIPGMDQNLQQQLQGQMQDESKDKSKENQQQQKDNNNNNNQK